MGLYSYKTMVKSEYSPSYLDTTNQQKAAIKAASKLSSKTQNYLQNALGNNPAAL